MAPNIPSDVSYALCQPPSFDIAPGTDILLGTILLETDSRPKRPDTREPLNEGQIPEIPESCIRRPPVTPQVILHAETLRLTSSSIWAHVDFLPGVGGRFGGERSKEKVLLVYAQDVETHYFNPSRTFFAKALKVDPVNDQLGDFASPVVYMVTGIKVAAKATVIMGTQRTKGAEVGPEIDLSQFGVPINVGADVVHKFKDLNMVGTVHNKPFVLAHETRRIKLKVDDHKQKMFRNFAVLDDEVADDLDEKLLDTLDISLVKAQTEQGDEGVGV
jgi:hypothetical protein